jgi:CheY-like chemotaxis protein
MSMPKILLVEDDNTMLMLLRTLLRFEGFDIAHLSEEETVDGIMKAIREEKPDLILLDVHLHQLDGFDLLQNIRKDRETKTVRVLMSSGMDFSARCAEEGADGFILKPYMPEDLIQIIRQALSE